MTVEAFVKAVGFTPLCLPVPEREIEGVYVGDLLSWVMGRAKTGDMWITIMSNVNIVAVATLTESSCVILAEGVSPDDGAIDTAKSKGINIVSTELSAYETAVLANKILK